MGQNDLGNLVLKWEFIFTFLGIFLFEMRHFHGYFCRRLVLQINFEFVHFKLISQFTLSYKIMRLFLQEHKEDIFVKIGQKID